MRLLFLFTLLFSSLNLFSQKSEINFAEYLIRNKQLQEAAYVLKQLPATDSVHFLLGESYFQLKQLDTAAIYYSKVTPASFLYNRAGFYGAFSNIFMQNFSSAEATLNLILTTDKQLLDLKKLDLAGIALLKRDYSKFEIISKEFNFSNFHIEKEQQNLITIKDQLLQVKSRSPFLAGMLSAVVPGAGKVYAGKWKQGLAYFGIMTALGLQWFETYKKRGTDSPYFYFYGSAFTLFYLGNIWGSALSVQIERNEQYKTLDNSILLNLQLPLRTVFP